MNKMHDWNIYRLACVLVEACGAELLHINQGDKGEEIWLQILSNNTTHMFRLTNKGYDWKNHLKKDIAATFQHVRVIRPHLRGKYVHIHNIYDSDHTPVENWDELKGTLTLKEKKPLQMDIYYVDDGDMVRELQRLSRYVPMILNHVADEDEDISSDDPGFYRQKLLEQLQQKEEKRQAKAKKKPAFATYTLLVINVLAFLLLEFTGGSKVTQHLIDFGANYHPAMMEGEWWRLLSAMFLHIGFIHLLMNMLALYYLGIIVEQIYGSWRFLVIYFLAGIGGGLTSFAFTTNVSAGASGAIFGLFGALLYFGIHHRQVFFKTMGQNLILLIGINLIFGMVMPGIDDSAHIGGLVTGFVAAAIIHLPWKKNVLLQGGAAIIYVGILTGLVVTGFHHNIAMYELDKAEHLQETGQYESVIEHTTKGLQEPSDVTANLLFKRSYAYIMLGKSKQAKNDLLELITINNEMPEAYANLAILYQQDNNKQKALEMIQKALKKRPDDAKFKQLYQQITGHSYQK